MGEIQIHFPTLQLIEEQEGWFDLHFRNDGVTIDQYYDLRIDKETMSEIVAAVVKSLIFKMLLPQDNRQEPNNDRD